MLFSITVDENASLQDHLFKIKDIKAQLSTTGWKMEEEDMVVIKLKSLPCVYKHFIETLNMTTMNVDQKFTTMNVDQKFNELCNTLLQ
jgi:hypothetical protein